MKRSRVNHPLAFFRFPDSTEFQKKKKSRIRHTTKLILKKKKFNCSYFESILLILLETIHVVIVVAFVTIYFLLFVLTD